MRREKRAAAPADELRRLLNTNYAEGDVGLRLGYSGCRKVVVENVDILLRIRFRREGGDQRKSSEDRGGI